MAGVDGSAAADEARRRLDDMRARTVDEIRRILAQLDTERGSDALMADKEALATASRVRSQIVRLLAERGGAIITEAERATIEAADAVAADVDLGEFDATIRRTLTDLVDGHRDELLATFGDAGQAIGEAMRASQVAGGSITDLVDHVALIVDASYKQAMAAVDTAAMGAGRVVTIEAGERMGELLGKRIVYAYVGPEDEKNRPFCGAHVNQAFALSVLDEHDNGRGQPKPVSVYLGGYNCRHSLVALTIDEAKEDGIPVVLR